MNIERRALQGLEIKRGLITGRAVVYNSRSEDLGGFVEVIAPYAFKDALKNDVRALIEHDPSKILGRTSAGTLRLIEDSNGILVEITPPNTRTADELIESISRGDIQGMSFGFSVPQGADEWNVETDPALRTVNKAMLHEVTITALPAYSETDVAVAKRSLEQHTEHRRIDAAIDRLTQFIEVNNL